MKKTTLLIFGFLFVCSGFLQAQYYALEFNPGDSPVLLDPELGSEILTLELWFRPGKDYDENNEETATLIYRDSPTQNEEFGLFIGPSDWVGREGRIVFTRNVGTEYHYIVSDQNLWESGRWYHVAGVLDPAEGMKLYINGKLQEDNNPTLTPTVFTNDIMAIGAWNETGMRPFEGQIDDVRLWWEAKSAAEIQQNMWSPVDMENTTGLWAYWNFNEGSGDSTMDMTGNGFHLDVADHGFSSTGTGLSFDGNETSVNLGNEIGNGLRTIEMWFKPADIIDSTLEETMALIARDAGNQNGEFSLYFGPHDWPEREGRLTFYKNTGNNTYYNIVSDQNVWYPDQWYHVAAVIDPNEGAKLYINGELQADQNPEGTEATDDTEDPLFIGKWGGQNIRYFKGLIDEVRLWSKAQSEDQIKLQNCGNFEVYLDSGLEAYLDFDDNLGDQVSNLVNMNSFTVNSDSAWIEIRKCQHEMTLYNITSVYDGKFGIPAFDIYPNPFSDVVRFRTGNSYQDDISLQVFTPDGKKLRAIQLSNSLEADLNILLPGIYFAQILQNNVPVGIRKIVKLE